MSLILPVWRTLSRQEVVRAHADSQYEWLCTDEVVLDELSYDSLPKVAPSEKSNKIHRMNFFRLLFLQKRHKMCPDALVEAWNKEYVMFHEDWMGKLKVCDSEWMRTIDGLKFYVHIASIRERIPCAVRLEYTCPHCPTRALKFNHELRAHPCYQMLSTQLLTAIGNLDDLFAQFALEQREPSRYCLMDRRSFDVFSLGVSEMTQATCDVKAMQAAFSRCEEVRKLKEHDRQEALVQLRKSVKETADIIRRLKRKVDDLENRSKHKK